MNKLAIIGAGSWGTALAIVLSRNSLPISLWVYEREICEQLVRTRENQVFLPGFCLPATVCPTTELAKALDRADTVLTVIPSHHCRSLYRQMLPYLKPEMRFVSATKGLETDTLLRMSEVIRQTVGERFSPAVAVLSGPTFAREIAAGEPAAVVIASDDPLLAREMQREFSGPSFRLYTNSDVAGVEYGASLKNVIAIGAGVCVGLGLGSNTIAALITRGLAEISRLAFAFGGRRETLAGLAGMGDLVLTCTGALSRNRMVGVELAHGRSLDEIVSSMRMVAEGVKTTTAAVDLARRAGVEMPITEQMKAMLFEGKPPRDAIRELMERTLKSE
jgi:glycerol-3-phosphate dehydrogenase (NAD(P)+)